MDIFEKKWIVKDRYLTEDAWLKIEDAFDRFMQKCEAERPEKEEDAALRVRWAFVAQKWQAFVRKQAFGAILPRFEDGAAMSDVQQVVNKQLLERPIKAADVQAIFKKHTRAQAKAWRESCDAALVKLMSDTLEQPIFRASLKPTTTYIARKAPGACREIYGAPEVLDTHRLTRGVEL
ncbi:hypothetical protein EV122DRAFT_273443 [Schizophyllum commune]